MKTNSSFDGQVAVVTGAGGTLCSAIARDLAGRGAKVALVGRTEASLQTVAQAIREAGGTALAVLADVTDPVAVEAARGKISQELGPCRFLINGAGGNQAAAVTTTNEFTPDELSWSTGGPARGFFNLDSAAFGAVVQANTLGTVIPCQIFGREMARLGRGAILNFASMNTYRPLTRNAAYAIAKSGVANFTQWLACYLAPAGVRVNGVAPGFFLNDRSRKILTDDAGVLTARGQNVMQHTPMKRFGQVADLLGCVRFLLDDEEAGFVTGVTIPVDGGFTAASGV